MSAVIKLSSPATHGFWEIPVLFEDEHLLALDKPADLQVSPDRLDPSRPSLMRLLHEAVTAGKPWAASRGLTYLSNAHRLESETSGVLLFAKHKAVLVQLADLFGSEKSRRQFLALVAGTPVEDRFQVNAKLAPHPVLPGQMRVDSRAGKRAETRFSVLERFAHHTLLQCEPLTDRLHQIRVHLWNSGLRVVGDNTYGGKPLWLSKLKRDYRLKPGREERPLLARVTLHAEQLSLLHPVSGAEVTITAPQPKDLRVALKYLREYSPARA